MTEVEGGGALVPSRTLEVQKLAQLPTGEWVQGVASLYPELVTAANLTQDLSSLEELSRHLSRAETLRVRGFQVSMASLVLLGGGISSVICTPLKTEGGIAFMVGFIALMAGMLVTTSGMGHGGIDIRVNRWNNRGINWLHQQRNRLFGS